MNFLHRTWAEIDLKALVHNFKILKSLSGDSKIIAVVKADAYGHSAKAIAPILEKEGADYFAVSNIEEALDLRKYGIKKPILILGYTPIECVEILKENDISQCVYSKEYALKLSEKAIKENTKIKVHIKLDTGMSRLGFNCRSEGLNGIKDAIESAKLKNLIIEGVFTHFAVSDGDSDSDEQFTKAQYERFTNALETLNKNGVTPTLAHCCNSAGFLSDNKKHLSVSRIGISLYGLTPSPKFEQDLVPVMTVKSIVSMVKEINKGDFISYGRTFKADKNMRIATVAVGYADGYPRSLSNKGYVLINGKKAKIVGRVCMDQMCVDVTDIPEVQMGDEVILFGKKLSVDVIAGLCDTINYEIVCGISKRVPRIIK
ncbi:MAG: alanine racemase [Clostridia bacterium]|nr:alanine racemase [Clostridia bacterium]